MRGASIMRTMSALLCALTCQTVSMTVSKKWLTNIDLDKIKAECEDECCNPPGSSAKATSSAIFGSVNTAIPEATTEHSEIRRLLILANENSKSGEAATEHSEIPETACQEAKRPRKSGKGTGSHARTPSPDPEEVAG